MHVPFSRQGRFEGRLGPMRQFWMTFAPFDVLKRGRVALRYRANKRGEVLAQLCLLEGHKCFDRKQVIWCLPRVACHVIDFPLAPTIPGPWGYCFRVRNNIEEWLQKLRPC
jgi:hypothetical protein